MSKRRRIIPATELRVHLGEALRGLDEEDIVVEKGGVPIAMLVKYGREAKAMSTAASAYDMALSRPALSDGWARTVAAANRGWAGIDAADLVADIYRWREEGVSRARYSLDSGDEADEGEDDADGDSEVPRRQRHLHQGDGQGTRVADERAEYDASRRPGD